MDKNETYSKLKNMRADYQIKSAELAKEQVFLQKYSSLRSTEREEKYHEELPNEERSL